MEQIKANTVAFTGHRNIRRKDKDCLHERIKAEIRKAYDNGYRYFMAGMAYGFDLMAAQCVVELREELPDIQLIAVIPYREQCKKWRKAEQWVYKRMLQQTDKAVVLNESFSRGCFFQRNTYMVKRASHVIAYFDGDPKGGTAYTIKAATQLGITITNIY